MKSLTNKLIKKLKSRPLSELAFNEDYSYCWGWESESIPYNVNSDHLHDLRIKKYMPLISLVKVLIPTSRLRRFFIFILQSADT